MGIGMKAEASNVVLGSLVVNSWTGSRGCHAVGIENSGDSRAPPCAAWSQPCPFRGDHPSSQLCLPSVQGGVSAAWL